MHARAKRNIGHSPASQRFSTLYAVYSVEPSPPLSLRTMPKKKIVLAYSGGLDTSVLLSWIKETYDAEMIAFCANIGQGEELDGLEKKAKQTGASKIYIDNLEEEFAKDFIFPMMRAGAIYENQY